MVRKTYPFFAAASLFCGLRNSRLKIKSPALFARGFSIKPLDRVYGLLGYKNGPLRIHQGCV